jgi:hypothetical protein
LFCELYALSTLAVHGAQCVGRSCVGTRGLRKCCRGPESLRAMVIVRR